MSTSGKACVNISNGKPSWISLKSTDNVFSNATTVTEVKDKKNLITFDARPRWRGDATVLPIKLQGKGRDFDDPPSEGTLTVTTTNGGPTPTDVPVTYVNDGT
jgi:hypothetical protein